MDVGGWPKQCSFERKFFSLSISRFFVQDSKDAVPGKYGSLSQTEIRDKKRRMIDRVENILDRSNVQSKHRNYVSKLNFVSHDVLINDLK